jgi:exopolysaccharide biosynthesis polyprenyl glycosylphosphotransferase
MTKVWLYFLASLFSLAILIAVRHLGGEAGARFMGESIGLVIVLLSCQICFHLSGVDEFWVDSKPHVFIQKILKSGGTGLLIAAFFFYIFPRLSPGYVTAAASACFLMFGLVALRPIARSFGRAEDPPGTVIVGSEETARRLYNEIIEREAPENIRIIGYQDLGRFAQQENISRVVVADHDIQTEDVAAQMLIDLKLRGVHIESALESFEKVGQKIWIEGLSTERLIFADGFCPSKIYLGCKRVLDILLALLLLLVAAPIMIVVAIIIKLETPGPAIFSQERVGLFGKKFNVYKFRSMRQDAERKTGPTWAKENDDRITRVGGFLRKARLDELPQVWNVLKGDMSFIGPRPERPYFVDLLKSKIRYYDLRHYVKPGITGWAQVMYPYGASVEDAYRKLQYDLYYAKNISLYLDLLILFKTIKVVASGQGR